MTPTFFVLMLARGATVLALALVATRVLRRAAASLRHTVLVAALAAVLVLPVLAAVLPVWHAGAIAGPTPDLVEAPALPIPEIGAVTAAPVPATAEAAPATSSSIPWRALAVGAWAAGAAALLLRALVGAVRARRIAARGTPVRSADRHVADAWRALGGVGDAPLVVASAEVDAPILVGAIAPTVVVPETSSAWTAERWRVVLLHELAHVRRRDGLANLVGQLACSLNWPNPFAWIAARHLREERELAADDAVLRDGKARASTYAEHLVAIAAQATYEAPSAALAMAEPSRFEARVVALLEADRSRGPAGVRRVVAVAGAVALVATAAACFSPEGAPVAEAPGGAPSAGAGSDPVLQAAVDDAVDHVMKDGASGSVAIILEAKTGAILAVANRGNVDAHGGMITGSTLKPFTFAAALEAGVVTPESRIDCENGTRKYGEKTVEDATPHGMLDLAGILAVSSNVCTAKIAELVGDRFAGALRQYHFAAPATIDPRTLEGASISYGEGLRISPLDLASGYTAFADDGVYHAPDGKSDRVMSAKTARAVMTMLEGVVTSPDGTGHAAAITNVRVAGKTGTASSRVADRHYASFVGIVPAEAPRYVVLVGVDGTTGYGGKVAAPIFAKLAARALAR